MKHEQHATVIGGGVVGLSIAWELVRRGFRVTLVERDQIGRATSWGSAGILPPANRSQATDPIDQLRGLSHELLPQWTAELQSMTGIDSGFRKCGGWYLADSKGEHAAMMGMREYWNELGIVCESMTSEALVAREPALASWAGTSADHSAWWVPGECQIRPPRYLRALRQACSIAGVELIENFLVTDIQPDRERVTIRSGDNWYCSDSAVVCGGPWTGLIAKSLELDYSIVPIRGQMMLLKTDVPLLHGVVNLGHRYLVCRDDGYTLVGSCEEETGFELGTTDTMLDSLRGFAISLVPSLESAQRVDAWSGLRPMTVDGFPMIGRAPGTSNVYIAAGHFRSGVHLSAGTAVLIADLITGSQTSLNVEPFRVGKHRSTSAVLSTGLMR